MPPEAEENGAHAQGRQANCSLQCMRCSTKSENAVNVDCSRMLIAADGHTVLSTEHKKERKKKKEKKKKVGFSLFGNKIHHSEICLLI